FRMLGKDLRCFVDFESARKLSFMKLEREEVVALRSFMAKSMMCRVKKSEQNPAELIFVCIPDESAKLVPPPAPVAPIAPERAPSPPPSKLEEERPILAALLRRKEPVPPTVEVPKKLEKPAVEKGKRKRLRSMNAIVESYSLDEIPFRPHHYHHPPVFIKPIPSAPPSINVQPYEVLAPNYKDIWLRLQSERMLLEERIVAKEGELKNLMLTAQYFPQNLTIPTLDMLHQL
uniref:Uncharacterized protein n=2 Tax=Caenorhabditis japonica TaxID=281687 RepID=A0A8R1HJN1_CAEJA